MVEKRHKTKEGFKQTGEKLNGYLMNVMLLEIAKLYSLNEKNEP
jgi:hypothetical protein